MLRKISLILTLILLVINIYSAEKSLERIANEKTAHADTLYNNKDYKTAANVYDEAIQKLLEAKAKDGIPVEDKIVEIKDKLFKSYYFGGFYEEAIQLLKQKIAKKSDLKTVKLIAQIYQKKMKQTQKAIDFLKERDSLKRSFILEKKMAKYYISMDSLKKALVWYNKAYELKKDKDVIRDIATIYLKLGENDKAVQAYNNFLKTKPNKSVLTKTYKNMAVLYESMNRVPKAIEYYNKTLKLKYNKDVNLKLIDLYYNQKNYDEALKKIDRILKRYPKNYDAIFFKALIYYDKGIKKQARAEFVILKKSSRYKKAAGQYIESIDSE